MPDDFRGPFPPPTDLPVGVPQVSRPTPNADDNIIVERVSITTPNYERLAYGAPHHKVSTARLCWQGPVQGNDTDKFVTRGYANFRTGQERYNAEVHYSGESRSHPIYIRSFLFERASYSAPAAGSTLTALISLRVTAAGSGYTNGEHPLTFSGGTGSGAEGTALVQNGLVVAVNLRNGGSYTAVPTVSLTAGAGTGATFSVGIQAAAAVLVEEMQQPAGGELNGTMIQVVRTYETLPGPEITSTFYDERGRLVTRTVQRVATGTAATADGLLVLSSRVQALNTVVAEKTTETVAEHGTLTSQHHNVPRAQGAKADIISTIVAPGTALTALSASVLSSEKRAISLTKSELIVEQLASGETQPVVYAVHVDETTGITIDIWTEIVAALSSARTAGGIEAVAGTSPQEYQYVEYQKIDKHIALKITSRLRLSSLPVDKTYFVTQRESFPHVMDEIVLIDITDTTARAGWRLIRGYSGPVQGKVTVKYMTDAAYQTWDTVVAGNIFTTRPALTQFFPRSDRPAVTGAGGTVFTQELPFSLHAAINESILGGAITVTVAATNPATLPWNTWIINSIREQEWRFGIWRVEVVEVLVPPNPYPPTP